MTNRLRPRQHAARIMATHSPEERKRLGQLVPPAWRPLVRTYCRVLMAKQRAQ